MTVWRLILAAVLLQRGGELVLAAINTRRLRARGAVEVDAGGYKYFVLLHAAWLASLFVLTPAATVPSWRLIGVFAALQAMRVWAVASLGRYWTTRLIAVPGGGPLVRRGPYRYLRHPNYLVVIGEIAVLPLAAGAVALAIGFSAANLLLILRRIGFEDAALAARRDGTHEPSDSRRPDPASPV